MTTAGQVRDAAEDAARQATRNSQFQFLGRVGLAAYGLVHLTIAYLAARVALGERGARADKGGALQTLAAQFGGRAVLWAVAVGLATLVVWQLAEATVGLRWVHPRNKRTRKRIESAVEAVVYGMLAITAGKLAAGGGGSPGKQEAFTARVLALPLGQVLVAAVGLALVGVAGAVAYSGVRKRFAEDLDLARAGHFAGRAAIRLGQIGYPALGLAYGIIGFLIVSMAVTYRPDKPVGFDAALTTLAAQPYGTALLLLAAAGLACFGVYCLFDARFRRG